MDREYHLREVLLEAESLRNYTYEDVHFTEIDDDWVLLVVTNHNTGTSYYLVHVWSGRRVPVEMLPWYRIEEVNTN